MGIKELLSLYLWKEIKLEFKDLSYITGVLKYNDNDFYIENVKLDLDNIKGWHLIKD